jgi:hypothetical protein
MDRDSLKLLGPLLTEMLGHRPSPATRWRWVTNGVKSGGRRVLLKATRIGGKLYSTVNDVQRFIDDQNQQTQPPASDPVRGESKSRRLRSAGLMD